MSEVGLSDDGPGAKRNGDEDRRQRQRKRSIAIALVLAALVVMFYAATLVQFGGR